MPEVPEKTTTETHDLPGAQATKRDRWSGSGVVPNSTAVSGMTIRVKHLNLTSAIPRRGRTRFARRRILGRSAGLASRLTRGQSELPAIEIGFARLGIYRLRPANRIIQGSLLIYEAVGALSRIFLRQAALGGDDGPFIRDAHLDRVGRNTRHTSDHGVSVSGFLHVRQGGQFSFGLKPVRNIVTVKTI